METSYNFILVHGAWHASWCWTPIAKMLRHHGHFVVTPDLPGHGKNNKPTSKPVLMKDYVAHVCSIVKQIPGPVILVGHSMAGLIISQVAELLPDAIRTLIFIAAYIPKGTQSLLSISQTSESKNLTPFLDFNERTQKIYLKPDPQLVNLFFNTCTAKDTQNALAKLQPQPIRPFIDTVETGAHFNLIPKRALISLYDKVLLPTDQLRMAQAATDIITHLEADHAAYYSAAKQIAQLLLE